MHILMLKLIEKVTEFLFNFFPSSYFSAKRFFSHDVSKIEFCTGFYRRIPQISLS
jgi:hypothetical protein